MTHLIISIIVISVVGTLSHFLYDFTNHNKYVGLFAAVNESTWEHIKIALTPTILWCLVDGFLYGTNQNYFLAKTGSMLMIIVLMPILFYGYLYITKKDNFIVDIIIFYVVIICSQFTFDGILKLSPVSQNVRVISCIAMFVVFGFYMIMTLLPIKGFIFRDPLTNDYGYDAHSEASNIMKNKKK